MNTSIPQEDRCETCFGTGQLVEMMPVRLGQKIATPPECHTCGGTGKTPGPDPEAADA